MVSVLKRLFGKKSSEREGPSEGEALREMMLASSPSDTGVTPSADFPRVYACMMDFGMSGHMFSVFVTSLGDGSLYSTSQFGIIGGGAHESVRESGRALIKIAEESFDHTSPTDDISYGPPEIVRFYFLTFDGLRKLDFRASNILDKDSPGYRLHAAGQNVLGQLRICSGL